jgi:hypothetical protein
MHHNSNRHEEDFLSFIIFCGFVRSDDVCRSGVPISSEHARRHLHLSPSEALAVIAAGRDAGVVSSGRNDELPRPVKGELDG